MSQADQPRQFGVRCTWGGYILDHGYVTFVLSFAAPLRGLVLAVDMKVEHTENIPLAVPFLQIFVDFCQGQFDNRVPIYQFPAHSVPCVSFLRAVSLHRILVGIYHTPVKMKAILGERNIRVEGDKFPGMSAKFCVELATTNVLHWR